MLTTSQAGAWLADYRAVIHENAAMLTDLDRQIGDADHGSNMDRGMSAIGGLQPEELGDAGAYLKKAGMTLVSTVGGASGPLYGTFLMRFGGALGGDVSDPDEICAALQAGYDGIVARGKASEGDKTLVDALAPAVRAAREASEGGGDVAGVLAAAAAAAAAGRDATTPMVARKGRASYLGERSAGVQDPGATSMTMLLESAARTLG